MEKEGLNAQEEAAKTEKSMLNKTAYTQQGCWTVPGQVGEISSLLMTNISILNN